MEETLEYLNGEIRELWNEHMEVPFPDGFAGKDINGIDFVSLDADIAGCVTTFIERGDLNLYQAAILGLCYQNASLVKSIINEEGTEYFWRLERLSELVLKAVARKNHTEHLRH